MIDRHSFHIPVMGIGFTIDTPIKVSQYGIDSVISIVDDMILEKMRQFYCKENNIPYTEISTREPDYRAKRITSYLNLLNNIALARFEQLKQNLQSVQKYLAMLPGPSTIREDVMKFFESLPTAADTRNWINENLFMGSIDVNIMTKVDNENVFQNQKLPPEFNDAHAALRGYAQSDLSSSVILSAGMNPRLYSYIEQFDDFFPDENGILKKKIILKVSDYRSSIIQGKFLAKKGLWVSEYRIESGLNCGGHAFATDGYLMGPILSEFKDKREELLRTMHETYVDALKRKNYTPPSQSLPVRLTYQGGVGTAEEHRFLIDHYKLDAVGWGSPFLLVPEVSNVDNETLEQLTAATEDDLYLSHISPLGVPFNNLRNSSKGREKDRLAAKGKPGSPCAKKYLAFDREFSDKALCTASSKYQRQKIKSLDNEDLSPSEYRKKYDQIIEKECICTGLGASALKIHDLDSKLEGDATTICPGPNIAYFTKIMSLKEITDHIYGRVNVITRTDRPNIFLKELQLYISYLKEQIERSNQEPSEKQRKYLENFASNLLTGINYYKDLFLQFEDAFQAIKKQMFKELEECTNSLNLILSDINLLTAEKQFL